MAKNDTYFLISGLISLVLFTFLLLLFFYMLSSSSKIDSYALKKDNYISISLENPLLELKSGKKSVNEPITHEVVPEAPKEKPQDINVDELFSDIWTKDISKKEEKPKQIDTKRLVNIKKKIQTSKENKSSDILDKVSQMDSDETQTDEIQTSSAEEVNEYLAKIQALVYKHFYPPQNSQGHSVKAVIELSAIGKVLDFRILNASANEALNEECDKIKDRLMGVVFPVNPDNKSGKYIIIITSKE